MRVLPDGSRPVAAPADVVELGVQAEADGRNTTHFPRSPARIDGAELQFLFDTGATLRLDEAAAVKLGDASVRQRSGHFITRGVMQRWGARHPEWRVFDKGAGGMAVNQVPAAGIAGYRTVTEWFQAGPTNERQASMAQ